MFWVKMVKYGNSFVIFTTSNKNSSEIREVLVQNFGLNMSVPKGNNSTIINEKDIDVTDDEEAKQDNSGEKNPLIEERDSVGPLQVYEKNR